MIHAHETVRQAVARALLQSPGNTDAAIEHAAESLGLPSSTPNFHFGPFLPADLNRINNLAALRRFSCSGTFG